MNRSTGAGCAQYPRAQGGGFFGARLRVRTLVGGQRPFKPHHLSYRSVRRPTFYYNACDVNSLTYELDDAGHQWALYLTEAKPLFLFTEMAGYYVVFNGEARGIY
jgi:hypothetical protein